MKQIIRSSDFIDAFGIEIHNGLKKDFCQIFPNFSFIQGNFNHQSLNGQGCYYLKDILEINGDFQNNKLNQGTIKIDSILYYQGMFDQYEQFSKGDFYFKDKLILKYDQNISINQLESLQKTHLKDIKNIHIYEEKDQKIELQIQIDDIYVKLQLNDNFYKITITEKDEDNYICGQQYKIWNYAKFSITKYQDDIKILQTKYYLSDGYIFKYLYESFSVQKQLLYKENMGGFKLIYKNNNISKVELPFFMNKIQFPDQKFNYQQNDFTFKNIQILVEGQQKIQFMNLTSCYSILQSSLEQLLNYKSAVEMYCYKYKQFRKLLEKQKGQQYDDKKQHHISGSEKTKVNMTKEEYNALRAATHDSNYKISYKPNTKIQKFWNLKCKDPKNENNIQEQDNVQKNVPDSQQVYYLDSNSSQQQNSCFNEDNMKIECLSYDNSDSRNSLKNYLNVFNNNNLQDNVQQRPNSNNNFSNNIIICSSESVISNQGDLSQSITSGQQNCFTLNQNEHINQLNNQTQITQTNDITLQQLSKKQKTYQLQQTYSFVQNPDFRQGIFQKSKLNSFCTIISDDIYYQGCMIKGQKHKYGTLIDKKKKISFSGFFVKDKKMGPFIIIYNNIQREVFFDQNEKLYEDPKYEQFGKAQIMMYDVQNPYFCLIEINDYYLVCQYNKDQKQFIEETDAVLANESANIYQGKIYPIGLQCILFESENNEIFKIDLQNGDVEMTGDQIIITYMQLQNIQNKYNNFQ